MSVPGRAVVVYATLFGTTERVAETVAAELTALLDEPVPALDLAHLDPSDLLGRELVVVGTPTWNVGQLPPDLEARLPELAGLDLRRSALALFGTGDQAGYPDTFLDAVGIVADALEPTGARLVGRWPAAGYRFEASLALRGGELLGLGVDEDNEPELTARRIAVWAERVAVEAGLAIRVSMASDDNRASGERAGASASAGG